MKKRNWTGTLWMCGFLGVLSLAASLAIAQRPGGNNAGQADDLVTRMMAFDANKDGKLSKEELTDDRLHRLFDRADADKDGVVTKAELTALAAAEPAGGRGGPGGFGGGPGGPGGGGPGFRPGEVLPPMFQSFLHLSAEQKTQVEELQKDVDARLEKILTDEQKPSGKRCEPEAPVVRAAADRAAGVADLAVRAVVDRAAAIPPIAPSDGDGSFDGIEARPNPCGNSLRQLAPARR